LFYLYSIKWYTEYIYTIQREKMCENYDNDKTREYKMIKTK